MAENQNKLKGNRNKKPVIITVIIIILIVWLFILYGSYAYLGYVRTNNIENPGMNDVLKAMNTLFTADSFKLPLTGDVIKDVFVMQYKDLWWLYVSIIVHILLMMTSGKKSDFKGIEHGSARWANPSEKAKFTDSTGIPCGENFYLTVNRPKKMYHETDNLNELVIGGSGAGKSFRKIKPDIIQMTGSYVVTDPSGELYRDMAGFLRNHGYKVRLFNLKDIQYSNTYNPFAYVSNENELLNLAKLFMNSTSGEGDKKDFWTGSAEKLLFTIMLYYFHHPDEEATFGKVVRLLATIQFDKEKGIISENCEIAQCVAEHQQREGKNDALSVYWDGIKGQPEETFGGIRATIEERLMHWVLPDMDTLMSTDEMDFDDIGVHKTAIFLTLPTADSTYSAVANLFYSQLFKRLMFIAERDYNARLPLLVSFELDEFANIGKIPDFTEILAVVRKYNIRMCIVLQGLSQIKAIYDKKMENILTNCSVITYLGTIDDESNKFISDKVGTTTVKLTSKSHNFGNQGGGSESDSYIERPLLKPNEIALALAPKPANNNIGSCIVIVKGFYAFFLTKFDLSKHKLFGEIGSYKGENQKNNANIYTDYEELRQKHIEAYNAEKRDEIQVADAVEKLPKTNVSTELQKQVDLDEYYRSVFQENDSDVVPFNYAELSDNDFVDFDGAEEEDWNG